MSTARQRKHKATVKDRLPIEWLRAFKQLNHLHDEWNRCRQQAAQEQAA